MLFRSDFERVGSQGVNESYSTLFTTRVKLYIIKPITTESRIRAHYLPRRKIREQKIPQLADS